MPVKARVVFIVGACVAFAGFSSPMTSDVGGPRSPGHSSSQTSRQQREDDARFAQVRERFEALAAQNDLAGIRTLGQTVLDKETSPRILQEAARWDKRGALALLEKAITRATALSLGITRQTVEPPVDELRWSYARSLADAGNLEGSAREAVYSIDENTRRVASLERAVNPPRQLGLMRKTLDARCEELAKWCVADRRLREVLLEYLGREEPSTGGLTLDPVLLNGRATIYEKLGEQDAALNCLVRAYASQISRATRERIAAVAQSNGKTADELLARASDIRIRQAQPAYAFDLERDTGGRMKLTDIKARAVLVNFFFPT